MEVLMGFRETCMQLSMGMPSVEENSQHHLEGADGEEDGFSHPAFPESLTTGEEAVMGSRSSVLGEVSMELPTKPTSAPRTRLEGGW